MGYVHRQLPVLHGSVRQFMGGHFLSVLGPQLALLQDRYTWSKVLSRHLLLLQPDLSNLQLHMQYHSHM
jgi:hypothetical protein